MLLLLGDVDLPGGWQLPVGQAQVAQPPLAIAGYLRQVPLLLLILDIAEPKQGFDRAKYDQGACMRAALFDDHASPAPLGIEGEHLYLPVFAGLLLDPGRDVGEESRIVR